MLTHQHLTFEVKGGQEEAHRFIDSLEIFSLLDNVADVKRLVIHPATTHSQLSPEKSIRPNTIRLSIGTEHIDDIIADLEKGLRRRPRINHPHIILNKVACQAALFAVGAFACRLLLPNLERQPV